VRWLVLANHLSPYMRALWAAVDASPGNAVRLVAAPRHDRAAYRHDPEDDARDALVTWTREWDPRPGLKELRDFRPSILVVLGVQKPFQLQVALAAARARAAHRVYAADTNVLAAARGPGDRLKAMAKRWVLPRLFQEALHLGDTNARALAQLGFEHLVELPVYAVDFERLGSAAAPGQADLDRWNAMRRPRHLCVARWVPEKNLPALVEALREVSPAGGAGSVTLVGEGPERAALEQAAAGLAPEVCWLAGARPNDLVGSLLREADGLVLPSVYEPWGIVVTEALGLGVPVIASRVVGAAASLAALAGGAIRLAGTEASDWAGALREAPGTLEARRGAARACAPAIRARFGLPEVARRFAEWGAQAGGAVKDRSS
jgi:glycosyltransferase involved in cell wall biosynthesis